VIPEDVKQVAVAALAHRMTLRPEMWLRRVAAADVVASLLEDVPTPSSGAVPAYGTLNFRPSEADVEQLAAGAPTVVPQWTPTRALGRAVQLVGVLVLLGALLGRPDLVAIAAPIAIGVALSLRRRPAAEPQVELDLPAEPPVEGAWSPPRCGWSTRRRTRSISSWPESPFHVGFRLDALNVHMRQTSAAGQVANIELEGPALRWGRHVVGPAQAYAVAGDALLVAEPVLTPAADLRVYPIPASFGLTSASRAHRLSSACIGPDGRVRAASWPAYAGTRPGDRLRRIDWRVTLRTGEPHVAATWSDRDATVVLLLDVGARRWSLGRRPRRSLHGGHCGPCGRGHRRALPSARRPRGPGGARRRLPIPARSTRSAPATEVLWTGCCWLVPTPVGFQQTDCQPMPTATTKPVTAPASCSTRIGFRASALVVVLTPLLGPEISRVLATLARAGRLVLASTRWATLPTVPSSVHCGHRWRSGCGEWSGEPDRSAAREPGCR
jgi:hypothetical protein